MADANSRGSTPRQDPERDFDRVPPVSAAPMSEEEEAAAKAIEAHAQANALRARQRLLAERAARAAQARPGTAAPGTAAPGAPEAAPAGPGAAPPPAPFQPTPGQQRWPVKTVTDDDQGQVDPQQTPKLA